MRGGVKSRGERAAPALVAAAGVRTAARATNPVAARPGVRNRSDGPAPEAARS